VVKIKTIPKRLQRSENIPKFIQEGSIMNHKLTKVVTIAFVAFGTAQAALAADQAQMMSTCNTYAAHHLHVSTSDIATLSYEGKRVDGTHAVNGSTTRGQTFQCSFNRSGSHVVKWYHSGAVSSGGAADEATMMSSCNTYAAHHLHVSTSEIASLSYEGQRVDGTHAVNGNTADGQTFQCSFDRTGMRIVNWYHSAPTNCPADISEANRYLYPACN
jgi:aerobic-type carbon monoxide dehydrogenase small subunit (CoxS/CutS family)